MNLTFAVFCILCKFYEHFNECIIWLFLFAETIVTEGDIRVLSHSEICSCRSVIFIEELKFINFESFLLCNLLHSTI
jgi:hypothetical protein